MPRKAAVANKVEEPNIKVLTSQDIKEQFSLSDYIRLAKQCSLKLYKDRGQHSCLWIIDQSGELQLILSDKSVKTCSYFGSYEGAKFEVVLEKSFFDKIKSYFLESKNENSIRINKFGTSSGASLSRL